MDSTMRRVRVHLADAPTDVLVWLSAQNAEWWYSLAGIAGSVAPRDAQHAMLTAADALVLLADMGYVERAGGVYRATQAGRDAVAAACGKQEVSGG